MQHTPHPYTRAADPAQPYITPTQVVPAAEQQLAPAPPAGMRVIGYQRDPESGALHQIYGPLYEPPAPLPPPPPGIDPQAQRTAARGVFAAGAGIGAYFGMQALALALQSLVQLLIAAAVMGAVFLTPGRRGETPVQQGPTYITHNRGAFSGWFTRTGPRK